MIRFITAAEAERLTIAYPGEKESYDILRIRKAIDEAIHFGSRCAEVNFKLSDDVTKELNELGYKTVFLATGSNRTYIQWNS